MPGYRIVPIPAEVADAVRATGRSPQYGHPAHVEVASGYGPCRSCLRTFHEGREGRILFTYNPFEGLDSYPSPGPVFVHSEACERFSGAELPAEIRALPLTLEGYGAGRWLVARERVEGGDVDGPVERLFAHAAVAYVHVRNTEAGCYIARLERGDEAPPGGPASLPIPGAPPEQGRR
jgi:hypothetical protein